MCFYKITRKIIRLEDLIAKGKDECGRKVIGSVSNIKVHKRLNIQ